LYNTLHDRDNIAHIISATLEVVTWLIVILVVLGIAGNFDSKSLQFNLNIGVSYEKYILPFMTSTLTLAFVFGNSLKNLWEAFLFIFVVRAFDVGKLDLNWLN
jgi:hypothetical protein